MTAEEKIFVNHLKDLDRQAQNKYYPCFTDFLDANEYSLFLENRQEFLSETQVFSGIEFLERQMVAFIPDALIFDMEYPIAVLKIKAKNPKFAGEMSHRDVLGTLMGLSLERKLIGDILKADDGFYVLVKDTVAELIIRELHRIRHTEVVVTQFTDIKEVSINRSFTPHFSTVSSMRLDCIVAQMGNLSRASALKLIEGGMVFVNARQIFHNAQQLKEGDVISIRKYGKFRIVQIGELSRKGKIKLSYEQYS